MIVLPCASGLAERRLVVLFACWLLLAAATVPQASQAGEQERRTFSVEVDGDWLGRGISYGPYREGQAPGGPLPSREQMAEDLKILSEHWDLIRIYGSREPAEDILKLVRELKLPLRVMLGAWITHETPGGALTEKAAAEGRAANEAEAASAIRLANAYPDVVLAVSVGNETQVYWSAHRTKPEVLLKYLRQVRKAVAQPVTTADDFNFWNKPESQAVADEVDFIVTHVYAMWGGLPLERALPWTQEIFAEVVAAHPDHTIVIGEAGWATQVHTEGEQAQLIKGRAGEAEQRVFYEAFKSWVEGEQICSFYFEAFDEPWKGGPHPDEVEKHWGLYGVDRQPKAAMQPESQP